MKKDLSWQQKFLKFIKENKKRSFQHSMIGFIFLSLFVFGFYYASHPDESEGTEAAMTTENLFTASMVGDMMFDRNVQTVVERYDYDHLFQHVKSYFHASDYVTGNFDQAIVLGEDYEKLDKDHHFKTTDPAPIKALEEANFTNVNLANNHSMDYGEQGMYDTIHSLRQSNVDFVGAGLDVEEAIENVAYDEFDELTIATLGFTDKFVEGFPAQENQAGVLPTDPHIFIEMIYEANQQADLVLVHIHWGQAYDGSVHSRQQELGRAMVEAGADLIIGHHPQVLGPVEVYEDRVIFYSLGNFIYDQGWTRTRESVLPQYHLDEDGKARIELHPLFIREATPAPPAGPTGDYHRERIFSQLTNESNVEWQKDEDYLYIELDHSFVLDEE